MLARTKGVSSKNHERGHVFRNAFNTSRTVSAHVFSLITLMGSICMWRACILCRGMGGLLVDVIQRQDNTVVQALVLIYAAISILRLLIGDIPDGRGGPAHPA